ncbi:MAG: hypothetical protein HQ592_05025 [Planctomycetes bacterium]|nr:hypothetical protein [Planctomycetota bacterium]
MPPGLPRGKLKCRKCGCDLLEAQPAGRIDRTGTTLAGYAILERLWAGAHADIYRAEQVSMHRTVALKVLGNEHTLDRDAIGRFLEAARQAAAIRHPNVVGVYDVDASECPCFSMEYVEGSTVRQLLGRAGMPRLTDAVRTAASVGQTLAEVLQSQTAGIRLSPDTVMLTGSGDVKILPSAFAASAATQGAAEERSVIEIGRFLYVLLTGIEPDPLRQDAQPPSEYNPGLSEALDNTVLQMLHAKEDGFASLGAATEALRKLSTRARSIDRKVETAFDHVRKRKAARKKRVIAGLAAFAGVAAAVVMALVIMRHGQRVEDRLELIRRCAADNMHNVTIEAGESFLADYPSHSSVKEISEYVARAREGAAARNRLKSLYSVISDVMAFAEHAPYLIEHHHSRLDEIARAFSDIENVHKRFIAPNKSQIKVMWDRQCRLFFEKFLPPAKTENGADVDKILHEMNAQCTQPGIVAADKAAKRVEALRLILDRIMIGRFTSIRNRAFLLEQNGNIEEAVALYQNVIDKWGPKAKASLSEKTFAQLAREAIEKLRAGKRSDGKRTNQEKEQHNGN